MKILGVTGLGGLWALNWAWQTFLGQSIGINENNTFQLKACFKNTVNFCLDQNISANNFLLDPLD